MIMAISPLCSPLFGMSFFCLFVSFNTLLLLLLLVPVLLLLRDSIIARSFSLNQLRVTTLALLHSLVSNRSAFIVRCDALHISFHFVSIRFRCRFKNGPTTHEDAMRT